MSVRKEYLITLASKLQVPKIQVQKIHWRVDREMERTSGLTTDLKSFCSPGNKKPKNKNTGLERPIQLGEGSTTFLAAVPFTGKSLNMSPNLINLILPIRK